MNIELSSYQITDYIYDPVIVVNKKTTKILYVNYETQSFLQKSKNFILNKGIDTIFNKFSNIDDYIKRSLKKFGNYLFTDVEVNIGKTTRRVNIEIVNNEKLNFLIITLKYKSDVSDYENDDELFHLDNIFDILSHELKNPLTSIKLATQLLEKKKIDNELTEIIIQECERIKNLIDLFQVKQLNQNITDEENNIYQTIRYVIKKFKLKNLSEIKILEEFDPSLPPCSIDKNNLIIVLDNLLENSISAIDKSNGYIKIITSFVFKGWKKIPGTRSNSSNNFISIIVEDNGRGIEAKNLKSVFYPFFSTKIQGKGVGLFLVKKIITHFGGTINVISDKSITKFEILLPIKKNEKYNHN